MLTARQLLVLRLIDAPLKPTLKEIAAAIGAKAHHTAVCHVERLIAKGMVERIPMKARALLITPKGKRALRRAPDGDPVPAPVEAA